MALSTRRPKKSEKIPGLMNQRVDHENVHTGVIRIFDTILTPPGQRHERLEKRAKAFVKIYKHERFGVGIALRPNESGKFPIYDAAKRIRCLQLIYPTGVNEFGHEVAVPVVITNEDFDDAFIGNNSDSQSVTANDKFRARYEAGRKDAVAVHEILEKAGIFWEIGRGRLPMNTTRSPSAFCELYGVMGAKNFRFLMKHYSNLFESQSAEGVIQPEALKADFIASLILLFKKTEFTVEQIAEALFRTGWTAENFMEVGLRKANSRYKQRDVVARTMENQVRAYLTGVIPFAA